MIHTFPCGTPALDFVGTLQARREPSPTEVMATTALLDAWLVESGLMDAAPDATETDREAAQQLRESLYALLDARLRDEPLPTHAVATANRFAEAPPVAARLVDGRARREGSVANGLSALAREAIAIIGGPDAALLRECGRPGCTQVYLDRSRGQRREWCAMGTCGNRMKAAAYRDRHRDD